MVYPSFSPFPFPLIFPFCRIFAAGLSFWCPVLGAFNAESFAFPPSKRSGVLFPAVFRRLSSFPHAKLQHFFQKCK